MPDDLGPDKYHDDLILNRQDIGTVLRQWRTSLGLSLRELEANSGVSDSEIYKVERGEQECRLESFIKITTALGVPPGWLIDDVIRTNDGIFAEAIKGDALFASLLVEMKVTDATAKQEIAILLSKFCQVVAFLLRCSNPARAAEFIRHQTPANRAAMVSFAARLNTLEGGAERLTVLGGLMRHPLTELRRLGLLPDSYLRRYLEFREMPSGERRGSTLFWSGMTYCLGIEKSIRDNEQVAGLIAGGIQEFTKDKSPLDDSNAAMLHLSSMPANKSLWDDLQKRVKSATEREGAKAALAAYLGVGASAVSQLRGGGMKLDAEKTLRLLAWVNAEEARHKPAAPSKPARAKAKKK